MSQLESSYFDVKKNIGGRGHLICVSKKQSVENIESLYQLGQRDFGENQVQELFQKSSELIHLSDIRWHFIGHLQSNKLNQLLSVSRLVAIHSIDRLSLLQKLLAKNPKSPIDLFLQINTSKEEQKGGFEVEEEVDRAIELIRASASFRFLGLMTIGRIRTNDFEKDARECFLQMSELKSHKYPEAELSMGMSSDYLIALEYGASWLRVGSQIFRRS